ncbi:MAG: amidohydrolase family protein [Rhodoferax sp.]|nr:amidohydrolase family protein [Rhodoferax sp.]
MIDAHFHIWRLARADYGWLTPAAGSIYRDVGLDDWRRVSAPCGVTAGILVQAAPTESETRFLLRQAHSAPDVLGVVGWTDMLAADAPERIQALALDPKLRGLRPMLQDIADPDWILQGALHDPLQAMRACGLALDALVKPVHLPRILALARRHPDLHIVIDHAAKPAIAHGQWRDWADGLQALAACPLVFCKLSGLWTEAAPGSDAALLEPYVRQVLQSFGPGKTLWGSDWPVLELAGAYAAWHTLVRELVAPEDHGAVFDRVARQAYRLV